MYVSCNEQSSGLFSVKMFNREVCWLLRNGEGNVRDIFGICQDQDNMLFTDLGAHQRKKVNLTNIVVTVIAGCGSEGNDDESADCVSFAQISGIYCEGGDIYVVDAQSHGRQPQITLFWPRFGSGFKCIVTKRKSAFLLTLTYYFEATVTPAEIS